MNKYELEIYQQDHTKILEKEYEKQVGKLREYAERIVGKKYVDECLEEAMDNSRDLNYLAIPRFMMEFLQQNVRVTTFNCFKRRRPFIQDAPVLTEVLKELKKNFPINMPENPSIFDNMEITRKIGEIINESLNHMTAASRDVFVRRYFYVETLEEIATKYHTTTENVSIVLENANDVVVYYLRKGGYYYGKE